MGTQQSSKTRQHRPDVVAKGALNLPLLNRLSGKRVILASASPRRQEILASIGLHPEIIPSTFEENLPKSEFKGPAAFEYPVETSTHKALEVYKRLVEQDEDDPPDLVISADTVVVKDEEILEKPSDPLDNMRMLAELNDGKCEVITGVTIVHPVLAAPGYKVRSLSERTVVRFATNPAHLLQAYVDSGEGLDRAGGFAIQGKASYLIRGIEGDYNNVVGFPLYSFCSFMHELIEDEELSFV